MICHLKIEFNTSNKILYCYAKFSILFGVIALLLI